MTRINVGIDNLVKLESGLSHNNKREKLSEKEPNFVEYVGDKQNNKPNSNISLSNEKNAELNKSAEAKLGDDEKKKKDDISEQLQPIIVFKLGVEHKEIQAKKNLEGGENRLMGFNKNNLFMGLDLGTDYIAEKESLMDVTSFENKKSGEEENQVDTLSFKTLDSNKKLNNFGINSLGDELLNFNKLSIGDKLSLQINKNDPSPIRHIADLQIIENKQSGDVHVLQIKLNPDNLGGVEARLRLHENGLQVELRAERLETARLLAEDHKILVKALENAGFKDDGRIVLNIVDKNHNIQTQFNAQTEQGDNGRNLNGQQQNFKQNSQEKRDGLPHEQFSLSQTPSSDSVSEEIHTMRSSHHLVV